MKYKIIAMDFDGTLLTKNKKITERTKKTLLECKQNNYIIVGVTAKNLSSVKNVCNIEMFNYLILNNGAYLYDVKNQEGNYINNLNRDIAKKITEHFKDMAEALVFCTTERYYKYKSEIKSKKNYWIKINKFEEVQDTIARMNIYANTNEELIQYKKYIDENFDTINSIFMQDTDTGSNRMWLSLNPKGMNKSITLKKLCGKLNINMCEVIFFGDGPNDIEIIQKVGMGVAMGNALPQVKEQAKKVTLSNEEDGIAVFLEKILKE